MIIAGISVKQRCFLKSVSVMCGPGQLCLTTIFELYDILDTHFSFNIIALYAVLKSQWAIL